MKFLSLFLLVISMILFSCDSTIDDGGISGGGDPIPDDIAAQGSIEDYQSTSIEYGLSMFRDVVGAGEENVLISPYSLQTALYMTMNGAEGNTLEEFRTALNTIPFFPNALIVYHDELASKLDPKGDNTNFNSQNAIFYEPALYTPDDNFQGELETYFNATFREENFSDASTVDLINHWVSEATEDRIEKVIDMIQSDEAMFLINALVFTADWAIGFEPDYTADRAFTKVDGSDISVPTMSSDDNRPYVVTEDYSAVDLSVKDEDYAVTFILPSETNSADGFISAFDPDQYNRIYDNLQTERVQVYLPKFELESSMNMKDILIARGMTNTFQDADLSGMGQWAGAQYLTRVLHDAYIKVDEMGIEGAAVTTVGVGVESLPPTISFDRPFVFVVRHIETRVPIFIGKVGNPLPE